jgi:hypothetical protein
MNSVAMTKSMNEKCAIQKTAKIRTITQEYHQHPIALLPKNIKH